jgi:hypothetical protein
VTGAQPEALASNCRVGQLNTTEATYYRWLNQLGGLKAWDAKQQKHLEKQNLKLSILLSGEEP